LIITPVPKPLSSPDGGGGGVGKENSLPRWDMTTRWRLLMSSWETGGEVGVERCQVDKVSGP